MATTKTPAKKKAAKKSAPKKGTKNKNGRAGSSRSGKVSHPEGQQAWERGESFACEKPE